MNRRDFLNRLMTGAAALGTATLLHPLAGRAQGGPAAPRRLAVASRTIEVAGKPARVFGLRQPDGTPGLTLEAGTALDLELANAADAATLIHWHGLTPPWAQDGVPDNPAALLPAGESRHYGFPAGPGGTHWMHAHTLQEQNLLAAPLIVRTADDLKRDEQEVVILLHDFSFTPPEELLARLKQGIMPGMAMGSGGAMGDGGAMGGMPGMGGGASGGMGGMGQGAMPGMMDHMMPGMGQMGGQVMGSQGMGSQGSGSQGTDPHSHGAGATPTAGAAPDLNDIDYDAYLANDRTLDDPEVVRAEKGGRVRLRIINGATATAFTIDTGRISGALIAVDGQEVEPVPGTSFPIAMGQRLDIRLEMPAAGGAFPILARREGARERTGIVLASAGATIARLAGLGESDGPVLGLDLERRLRPRRPLAVRPADRKVELTLAGAMAGYDWRIDGGDGLHVKRGERIEVVLHNATPMAHPMHLHGHHFQVVGIGGKRLVGAVRDTVLVPPAARVTLAFDADNPGRWPFHCHHLYHMASGMMTYVAYADIG